MRVGRPKQTLAGLCALVAVIAVVTTLPRGAAAASSPPSMSFTPDVRADTSEGSHFGQNEPVVWADQSGRSFITWQGGSNDGTNTVATSDGVTFSQLANTDPAGSQGGDVTLASTSWPNTTVHVPVGPSGENGVFWGDLGGNTCGALGSRASVSIDQGATWQNAQDDACQPAQIDRDWIAAYTPPLYRGGTQAVSHTFVYNAYHDFVASNVWVSRSTDGGATWTNTPGSQFNAIQPGSAAAASSLCNTYPGGVAVDQNGTQHQGRVYVVWNAGDTPQNQSNGCNVSSAQPFDHIFLSYSDDNGSTWTTHTVFNDPCAPSPPVPPVNPTTCQDTSAGWTPVAVDDAGNVYVAFTWIDTSKPSPRYDVYLEVSKDGGNTWNGGSLGTGLGFLDAPGAPIDVTANLPGTSFYPELAAGGNGGVDLGLYNTAFTTQPGMFNKAGAQPESAVWDVYMAQSLNALDAAPSWTISKVTTHPNYFGDICTVGIACGLVPGVPGDRILADNFGISVAPDGGARVTWTDTRDSWSSTCQPGPPSDTSDNNVGCQNTHVYFACQTSGVGIAGQTVTGCGQSQLLETNVPEAPLIPALVIGAGGVAMLARRVLQRRLRPSVSQPLT